MRSKLTALFVLCFTSLFSLSQPCFELDRGKGLSLFSPFLKATPRSKTEAVGYSFGDTSLTKSCAGRGKKSVLCSYKLLESENIFAVHSGVVNVFTTTSTFEENQENDAVWINGNTITSSYMGIYPSVQTGQYVYAGQLIGKAYKERNQENLFSFSIRRAPPVNPTLKRGYLPIISDRNNCECKLDPLWPEYFIYPASRYINYDRMNEFLPEASLKVNMTPSGIGKWSFDDGTTWLQANEKISGLPFGSYKIIFKSEYGYHTPPPTYIKTTNCNKEFAANVQYEPDYTILKKPEALLEKEKAEGKADEKLHVALDSLNKLIIANDKTASIKSMIIDSLNERFLKIEAIQKETFFFTRLFKYILPILLLAFLFAIILFFQNYKIRKQKRYLENWVTFIKWGVRLILLHGYIIYRSFFTQGVIGIF